MEKKNVRDQFPIDLFVSVNAVQCMYISTMIVNVGEQVQAGSRMSPTTVSSATELHYRPAEPRNLKNWSARKSFNIEGKYVFSPGKI